VIELMDTFWKNQHVSAGYILDTLFKKSQWNHNVSAGYMPPSPSERAIEGGVIFDRWSKHVFHSNLCRFLLMFAPNVHLQLSKGAECCCPILFLSLVSVVLNTLNNCSQVAEFAMIERSWSARQKNEVGGHPGNSNSSKTVNGSKSLDPCYD